MNLPGVIMEQKFGEFVREKRLERGLKLKTFAQLIGISAVYESYIENGKRPAPSPLILQKMASELQLSQEEEIHLCSLAELSRRQSNIPEDVWEYIASRPYVYKTLRLATERNTARKTWEKIERIIERE